ncbi:hypothetical protein [Bradyrhizobium sp. BR 10289]|uniref:hypothetical protein n=1 Tax=Bradyrhizobium sp. BR 10289 TaxID=2749993 RepID=UPI001C64A44F|nr:hypothetical protein [Bradyrhizobium sp. BR 10289]MBW7970964.1 hypothetical protein [Bradyrhizobium sp. BR 10289]
MSTDPFPTIVAPLMADVASVTIASGQSLSGSVDLGRQRAVRVIIPATWTAANLTFQVSYDNVTFSNLYDSSGNEYTVQAGASRSIILPVADFIGIRYLKVRSGTSGAAVNQTSAATLIIPVQ